MGWYLCGCYRYDFTQCGGRYSCGESGWAAETLGMRVATCIVGTCVRPFTPCPKVSDDPMCCCPSPPWSQPGFEGPAAIPQSSGIIGSWRESLRRRSRGELKETDARVVAAYGQLIKLPEHTYGSSDGLEARLPFDNKYMDRHMNYSAYFVTTARGWADQRDGNFEIIFGPICLFGNLLDHLSHCSSALPPYTRRAM